MAPQSKGGQKTQKKTIEAGSSTPRKFILCCFFAIRVWMWFVGFQMALLQHFKSFEMNKK
jgi:hypothetical protein